MRKTQKTQAQSFLKLLEQAHLEIKKSIEDNHLTTAMTLLAQCQEGAIELGNLIEKEEGENFTTISLIESYCELTYQIHETLWQSQSQSQSRLTAPDSQPYPEATPDPPAPTTPEKIHKALKKSLIPIENSIKNHIHPRLEIAFLPYKASMWDSLESVWMAASQDLNCDTYVVPIPYYDRNEDKSLGTLHYEGDHFPDYVPITHYTTYSLEERTPDIIYIHNPYDQGNYVTTIAPQYYSSELKKHTQCLVYIPYYTTAGGMSEGQSLCMAYLYADYLVVQSQRFIQFFDPRIPREKFLPLGSPKFDRIIRLCKNPPQPPASWTPKLKGRKVYFYNTSLGGMLGDTRAFLKKMEYVFRCFEGREDACLLWRPHPLLETTFQSMRKDYYDAYKKLKHHFIEDNLGIYDDTPDIADTIALCDAYVGDAGTSVTSLFGIAGKPLFILDNNINTSPAPDDWRGQIIKAIYGDGENRWIITQGNKLYYSPDNDYRYRFSCDLSSYAGGDYYCRAVEIGGTVYACPQNAQDILVIKDYRVQRRIPLEHCLEQSGAFAGAWNIGQYLLLIPNKYPAIVRYDTVQDKVDYIKGYNDIFAKYVEGKWMIGGSGIWNQYLMLASPDDNQVLAIDSSTGSVQLLTTEATKAQGCMGMISDGTDMWMVPYSGAVITRWNPDTGEIQEYTDVPKDFLCKSIPAGYDCLENPFGSAAFYQNKVFITPCWGNMFLCLDKDTGEIRKWNFPLPLPEKQKSGYYSSWSPGYFVEPTDTLGEGTYRFFSQKDCRLYDLSLKTGEYTEIPIEYDPEELKRHEPGFAESSDWFQYGCGENCFNSLEDFLEGNVTGAAFDRERQIEAYREIAANHDGTCGEKIHQVVCGTI